jgi:hypothetical protein
MVVVALLIVVGIAVATVFVLAVVRDASQRVDRIEAELHAPGVRTMSYAVPPGRDPAALMAAVARAGYHGIAENPTLLVVACPNAGDPEKVRLLLENA